MSRCIAHKLNGGLGEHAAAWDELRHRLCKANPMLNSRFVDALLAHFGDGSEYLCILHADGLPQAMCVLRAQRNGIWTSFFPSPVLIGPMLISRSQMASDLFIGLPDVARHITLLGNDPAYQLPAQKSDQRITSKDHSLVMSVDFAGSFDDYWSTRSKGLAHEFAMVERHISANSIATKFHCHTSPADLLDAMTHHAALESRQRAGHKKRAESTSNVHRSFYQDICARFAQTGHTLAFQLWLDDRLAASQIAIVDGSTAIILLTAVDESLATYLPSRLIQRKVLEHMFRTYPGGRMEFYDNVCQEQLAWATTHRKSQHIDLFRKSLFINLLSMLGTGRADLSEGGTTSSIHAGTVRTFQHFDRLPIEVEQLFLDAESVNIEFGPTWYKNLVDSVYPTDKGIQIFVLYDDDQPVAAIPTLAAGSAMNKKIASLSNYYSAIYAPVVRPGVKARDLVPLITAMRSSFPFLGSMKFAPMDPESKAYGLLFDALRMAGLPPFEYYCFGNWFLRVDGRWADYLKGRSATFRSNIKRASKKFTAEGGTLELILGGAELERGLMAYDRVYSGSWKIPEPFANFVPGLIRACAVRGWLRLGIAWLRGEPIAAQLWIVAGARANIYKVAYHEDYKGYAPGTLLAAMLIEHVIDQDGVAEVDYMIGDDPYKKTWMSDRRERWGIVAYNPRSAAGLVGLALELSGRAIKPAVTGAKLMSSRISARFYEIRSSLQARARRLFKWRATNTE